MQLQWQQLPHRRLPSYDLQHPHHADTDEKRRGDWNRRGDEGRCDKMREEKMRRKESMGDERRKDEMKEGERRVKKRYKDEMREHQEK